VASLTADLEQARGQLEETTSKNADVTRELQDIRGVSANALQIRDQNESLKQHVTETEQRLDRLSMENTELQSENRQQWFVAGAGVLFGGILIGLVAPHLKRKRRSSW
jgi:SH3 domain protein